MVDEMTERLIKAGLQPSGPAPVNGGEPMVQVGIDGEMRQVPATVGIYMAVSNMNAMLQEVIAILAGIHHHASGRVRRECQICVAIKHAQDTAVQQAVAEVVQEESQEQE